jgi:phage tail-like protein
MTMAANDPPFTAFRFEVVLELDEPTAGLDGPLCDAAFAECDGLEMTMQTKTLEVGGFNDRQVHLIGPVTYAPLTLKRGMTANLQLWQWFASVTRPGSARTAHGQVTMSAADGTPALRFTLTGCLPVKLRAPALNARDGLVAIEELGLVYSRLDVTAPGEPAPAAAPGGAVSVSLGGGLR